MSKTVCMGLMTLGILACGTGMAKQTNTDSGVGRSAGGDVLANRILVSGTAVSAALIDSLASPGTGTGETVHASVSADVMDSQGHLVIPAGSVVLLRIVHIDPANDQTMPGGRLEMTLSSVTVRGQSYPIVGELDAVPFTLKGRGITKAEAERVGAGTVIG